jgi:hypothetical protein
MASADWTELTNSAASSIIARGVTSGIARPNGGGSFVYGYASKLVTPGTVGSFVNLTNFAPTPANKGGSISGAIKRGASGGDENFAPFLFICAQGPAIADNTYMLGLGDGDPYHIVLKKGAMSALLEDLAPDPTQNGILLRSSNSYTISQDLWHHIRLDAIVQGSGDVILVAYESDLTSNPVTAPSWSLIPGMEGAQHPTISGFVDDALGVNSGSAPYTNGRMGHGMRSEDVTRRGYLDHLVCARQL